ncbi:MAG: hypothetical protein EPO35_01890 [Acidobacteria bacterium]|nr:MAG: hypothetical protein EPO35_01890 [Acidobacteriota bacterium]
MIPRAEFRVFGQGLIAELQPHLWNGRTTLQQMRKMPAEIYFLSRQTADANVKVRDELLDIKVKTGTTPEGFEIFEPKGKFQFPVTHENLALIASALRISLPEPMASARLVSFEAFLEMARAHPDLAVVEVEKNRWGFSIDGVTCEYAQVFFNGAMIESVCVESENYKSMPAVIAALGLAGRPNTNYISAAAKVVGLQRAAAGSLA